MLTKSDLRSMDEYRNREVLRSLLNHDNRMLEDMGLTRIEIELALKLPMDRNAMAEAKAGSARSLGLDRRLGEPYAPPARRPAPQQRDVGWATWLAGALSRAI
ncbi:MAG: hypothetical protein AAF698_05870 [Pseudomonadota bacterium]